MTDPTLSPVLDVSGFDDRIRVQDDLYRHVNGRWLETTEIAPDKPLAGAFIALRDQAEEAVRDIITTLEPKESDSEATKISDLYASFMDTEAIEAAGVTPLTPFFTAVDGVTSPAQLMTLLGGFSRSGVSGLVGVDAESDPGNPTRYVMFAGQGGLGLPDEAYYRLDEHAEIRQQYGIHVAVMLGLAGIDDPVTGAEEIVALETAIAACHWDKVRCRDLREMYNLVTLDGFTTQTPDLHWPEFLTGADISASAMNEFVVMQPSFFDEVTGLINDERLPAWLLWAKWRVITSLAPYLSSAFVDANFAFYGTALSGTPELRERWKRGVGLVEGSLGEAVGKVYVERHFSATAKQRMDELVANLIEAYRQSIHQLDWMTEQTKAEALIKLGKFRPHIGYPTQWRDYSALTISRDDLIGNVARVASFELNRSLAKIGQPIDREEWLMTPQTVNAYYHPLKNEIVFPAAILQPPFFNSDADDAVNYGGIGAVIGHEIGHGFDDQGSTCDGDGALRDWWTADDRTAFDRLAAVLINQYNALEPAQTPGYRVNGKLTIGENIGDLGGLGIAFRAYQLAHAGQPERELDGYTPAQRLFLSWAVVWQTKIRTEMLIQRLTTDPHSPAEFRCNQIVSNIDEFYQAFEVSPDDKLWLDPDSRVQIW